MSEYIYTVVTPAGPIFGCDEFPNAESFADLYHGDHGVKVEVVVSVTLEVVYSTGN